MNFADRVIRILPDAYRKDKSSNNYKLFNCILPEFDLFYETCEELKRSLDMDYAYGKTLDKIGANVNQVRGSVNDTVLRTLIKAKIAADMSDGTIMTLLTVIGFIIGDDESRTQIIELFNDAYDEEPAAVRVIAPIDSVIGSGVTAGQFVQILEQIKPAGVRIIANLNGTFEFGEIEEYGEEFDIGFADVDQTTGGTLGLLYDTGDDDPLPIG